MDKPRSTRRFRPKKSPAKSSVKQKNTAEVPPPRYRLFYAIRVPIDIATELATAQQKLRGNWRPVLPEHMHITLAYVPTVPPERLDELKRLGASLTKDIPAPTISLHGTGYFPNEGRPRVWFVNAKAPALPSLSERLCQGLTELGLDTGDLSFKAHVTLARRKGPAPRVPPLLFEQSWTAPQMILYRSLLQKTGPIYEVRSTFRFRGTEANTTNPNPSTKPDTKPEESRSEENT